MGMDERQYCSIYTLSQFYSCKIMDTDKNVLDAVLIASCVEKFRKQQHEITEIKLHLLF